MWKKPYRNNGEITQNFNDGVLSVYSVEDEARPGRQPVARLEKKFSLRFEERKIGINRYYSSMQNQIRIERVLRVNKISNVNTQDVVIISGNETAYRIDLVQYIDDVYPQSMDLTLIRYEQKYEVIS